MYEARLRLLVEALRSGEFTQTYRLLGTTKNGVEYNCAGGVACRVAMANGMDVNVTREGDGILFNGLTYLVPDEVWYWFGVNPYGRLPVWDREAVQQGVSGLNDSGFTFDQIADLIEHFWINDLVYA